MNVAMGEVRETILSRFETARASIDIICFEVSSADVIDILRKKCAEGVEVSVRCEHRKIGDGLLALAECAPNIRLQTSKPNQAYYALHEKLILIDDDVLLFGTFNLSEVSFEQNAELLFETIHPTHLTAARKHIKEIDHSLAKMRTHEPYSECLDVNSAPKMRRNLAFPNLTKKTSYLIFSDEYNLFEVIRSAISSAKRHVTIYASHRISKEILDMIRKALERDVAVRVVKDASALQDWDFYATGRQVTRVVSVSGKMHIKAILIDDTGFLVGSLNLFERSLYRDQELLFIGNDYHVRHLIEKKLVKINALEKSIDFTKCRQFMSKSLNNKMRRIAKKIGRSIGVLKSG